MPMRNPSFADRFYAALLRLLPFDFRAEFGSDMEQVFREQRSHVERESSRSALFQMWWATIRDIFRVAPREHLSILVHDTRYTCRMMRKNLGYTFTAILILALGIGANSAVFSVVNSVLLQPLPYAYGDRLVVLSQQGKRAGIDSLLFSPPEFREYKERSRTLSALVEYHTMLFTLLTRDSARRVRAGVVSSGFFDFFGVKPVLGRAFSTDDERPGAPAVLLLSYEFWKQNERGDSNVVGKTFEMNDRVHTVIGVLPPIPQYPNDNDVYMTTTSCPFRSAPQNAVNRNWRLLSVFGRLKPGVALERCRSELSSIANVLERDYPQAYPSALGYAVGAAGLKDKLTGKAHALLLLLLATAGFVLVIACANVANLVLARMARREKELVIRTALGAGSGRLLRQLLTESLILTLIAAAAGLVLAAASLKLLIAFAAQVTPRASEITMDYRVALFAVFCAGTTAIVCGSIAALHSRKDLASGVRDSTTRATLSAKHSFVRGVLIAAQVSFSYVLLIGAGLMLRSFIQLERVDPGFVPERVFAAGIDLNWSKYTTAAQTHELSDRLLAKIQSQPGVMSAAVSSSFPLDPDALEDGGNTLGFRVYGRAVSEAEKYPVASLRITTPGYFRTLGIRLVRGRIFRDSDAPDALPVVLISESLARHYWPREDPVAKKISLNGTQWLTVVGVVGDVKEFGLAQEAPDQIYLTMAQNPSVGSVLVRAAGDPGTIANEVRTAIRSIDPRMAITRLQTLEQVRADSVSSPRTVASLFAVFSGLALVIAVTGLGCMLSLMVRQRTQEIGIRMALGATPGQVIQIVVRQGAVLTLIGVGIGCAGALAVTRFMANFLFQTHPNDLLTFLLVSGVLFGAALIAAYLPARRAARIDPHIALRCE